MVAHPKVGP